MMPDKMQNVSTAAGIIQKVELLHLAQDLHPNGEANKHEPLMKIRENCDIWGALHVIEYHL